MGHFIFSFFKELNSATNKNMIALALVLGLISGFLPTFTAINYLIFLFVLIFRIPIGLYTASFAVFSLFSYLFDPVFNKIGYIILTSSFLKPLWTMLYNTPLMRWSGYNNTLVMGSLVCGIIVGGIFYFIIIKSIDKYRKTIFPKIKNIKFLSWIVPSEEKKGIIRISGIVAASAVIASVALILTLFLDPFLKFALGFTLSKTLHKKVYIESLKTKLSAPSLYIKNMQIDNFLITKAYVKFNMENILWRKFDIQNLEIDSKTNASILDVLKKENKTSSKNENFKLPKITLPKAEDILQKQSLKSEAALKKLQKDYENFEKYYKSLNVSQYKKETEKIKNEIQSLKNLNIKTPDDILKAKQKLSQIQKDIKNLQQNADNNIKELQKYKTLLQNDIKNLKTALNEDYQNIKYQFSLVKSGNLVKLSEIYFKPQISKYISLADKVFNKIKPYLKKSEEKREVVIPRRGIYIKYEDKIKIPDFLLENGKISLQTSIAKYKSVLKNISDNQQLLNRPAVVELTGNSKFYKVKLHAQYLKDVQFDGSVDDIKVKKMVFGELAILHPVINSDFNGVYDNDLTLNSIIVFNGAKVVYKKNDKFSKIINNVLSSVTKFKVYVKVQGKNISVSSDLDKIISKALLKVYKAELQKQEKRAFAILNKKINSQLKKYNLDAIDSDIKSFKDMKSYLNKLLKSAQKELVKKEKNNIKNKIFKNLKLF